LGRELLTAVRQEPGQRPLRLHVGVADSVPKIIVRHHLSPVIELGRLVRVICREGSLEELITQLAGHKLDVVLADEPSTSALRVRTFNQRLQHLGCRALRRSGPCQTPFQGISEFLGWRASDTPCR
jgi:LysR family transcriptional regulator, transcriptional activator of nhaA